MNRNRMILQMYDVPANENITTDYAPAISVDFSTRISENIRTLQEILGVTAMEPMASGSFVKIYGWKNVTLAQQVGEGETIPLTKVERVLVKTIELTLDKFRRQTTAEAIQRNGRDIAINQSDEHLVSAVRGGVKNKFFSAISAGLGVATRGATLQKTLANIWTKLQRYYVDKDVTPIYFVSSDDIGEYLGDATVTTQTAFGFTYIEDFLGLGTVIINPGLPAGVVVGTVKENLHGAYVPASGGDLAQSFGLTGDQSGLVGMTHQIATDNASVTTLLFCSVVFYPEFADGVFVAGASGATGATGSTGLGA